MKLPEDIKALFEETMRDVLSEDLQALKKKLIKSNQSLPPDALAALCQSTATSISMGIFGILAKLMGDKDIQPYFEDFLAIFKEVTNEAIASFLKDYYEEPENKENYAQELAFIRMNQNPPEKLN